MRFTGLGFAVTRLRIDMSLGGNADVWNSCG